MAPTLYKKNASPPCRAVLLVARALDIELEYKDVNMSNNEHHDADFVELNPQHSVPVLDDEGFILCDSHAIATYLVSKFSTEDDSLYPTDFQKRALVDQRLYFDTGVLQSLLRQIMNPILFDGEKTISEKLIDRTIEAYGFMEAFLQNDEWFAGDSMTLADLSLAPTVTSLNVLIPIDEDVYPKVTEWIARVGELPYYDANMVGLDEFKNIYEIFIA